MLTADSFWDKTSNFFVIKIITDKDWLHFVRTYFLTDFFWFTPCAPWSDSPSTLAPQHSTFPVASLSAAFPLDKIYFLVRCTLSFTDFWLHFFSEHQKDPQLQFLLLCMRSNLKREDFLSKTSKYRKLWLFEAIG
jgi:hypothetical protein